jgi:hypothetical protein
VKHQPEKRASTGMCIVIGLSLGALHCADSSASHPARAAPEPTLPSAEPPSPPQAEPATLAPVQQDSTTATDPSRDTALLIARACISRRKQGDKGGHGSPLVYEKATVTRPSELRARGEKGASAAKSDTFRVVWIPESPPFDERVPNGVALEVNLSTRACVFPKYMR